MKPAKKLKRKVFLEEILFNSRKLINGKMANQLRNLRVGNKKPLPKSRPEKRGKIYNLLLI